jgi:uncharacterized protein (DUF1697 family)
MKTYIALLRGINVSGYKIIKMMDLRNLLAKHNFNNIRTYIQSGNIIFQTDNSDLQSIEREIHTIIKDYYDFEVPVFVINAKDIIRISKNNPFLIKRNEEINKLFVAFFNNIPEPSLVNNIKYSKAQKEEFLLMDKYFYLYYPEGVGKSKFSNNYIEQKLKIQSTIRNWKTVMKLVEITKEVSLQ